MQERERRPGEGGQAGRDIPAANKGDYSFTDWDNPEDEVEEAPEGYYDVQTGGRPAEEMDEEYELRPDDPDYDLSEGAGYSGWEGRGRRSLVPYWVIVGVSLLLIFALLLPALLRLT